jgi:hypothetical protein
LRAWHLQCATSPVQRSYCSYCEPGTAQGLFTRKFNKLHNRRGTLWQGRFRSYLLPDVRALFRCFTYVEANAQRARIVSHPRDYRFGTYRYMVATRGDPAILLLLRELCEATPEEYPRTLFFAEVEEEFARIKARLTSPT